MGMSDDGRNRGAISSGICVDIVLKQDQRTGKKTRGIVGDILTNSTFHPHGIKVRLRDGKVGRVCGIVQEKESDLAIIE
ncbi:MAG TPA: YwbE family protein [Methanospirillum sp.]|nr:YwbE family protein [Methanospirillum sp.]